MVEPGIFASVLVLGVLVAAAARIPVLASSFLVGVFAIFHGHAHGAETPEAVSGLAYGTGLVLTTIFLHGVGIGLGSLTQRWATANALRPFPVKGNNERS